MLETLLKPNTGASLSGCVRWTQPMDGVRVCDFDCALTVPPALPAEPSEVPCEVLFCRQGGLRLTMTDGRQVFLQEHEVLLLLGASVQSLSVADGLFGGAHRAERSGTVPSGGQRSTNQSPRHFAFGLRSAAQRGVD